MKKGIKYLLAVCWGVTLYASTCVAGYYSYEITKFSQRLGDVNFDAKISGSGVYSDFQAGYSFTFNPTETYNTYPIKWICSAPEVLFRLEKQVIGKSDELLVELGGGGLDSQWVQFVKGDTYRVTIIPDYDYIAKKGAYVKANKLVSFSLEIGLRLSFEPNFFVIFDANGGKIYDVNKGIYSKSMIQLAQTPGSTYRNFPSVKRDGYGFDGWFTSPVGGREVWSYDTSSKVTTSINVLYAHWNPSYTVSYKKGKYGSGIEKTVTKKPGVPLKLSGELFVRAGYSQKGWSEFDFDTADVSATDYGLNSTYYLDSNITLYPVWQKEVESPKCIITYNSNGGAGVMGKQMVDYAESFRLNKNQFLRDGYDFLGWSTDSNAVKPMFYDEDYVSFIKDSVLYAVWSINPTYKVVFEANGGTGVMYDQVFTSGASGKLRENSYQKKGYRFVGWATRANGDVVYQDYQSITFNRTSDLYLYAVWEAVEVRIDFDGNYENIGNVHSAFYQYGNAFGLLPQPKRAGYAFMGWFTAPNSGLKITDMSPVPEIYTVYYAHWQVVTRNVEVVFNANGGYFDSGDVVKKTYSVGEDCHASYGNLPTPLRDNHLFVGWYDSLEYTRLLSSDSRVPLEGGVAYARWQHLEDSSTITDVYAMQVDASHDVGVVSLPIVASGAFCEYEGESSTEFGKHSELIFSIPKDGEYTIYLPKADVFVVIYDSMEQVVCENKGGMIRVSLKMGQRYYLRVYHVGERLGSTPKVVWRQTVYIVQIGGEKPYVPFLVAPNNVCASNGRSDGICISWDPVEGAERYMVYKWYIPPPEKTGGKAYPYYLATTKDTKYLDADIVGTYHVVAVGADSISWESSLVKGKSLDTFEVFPEKMSVPATGGEFYITVDGNIEFWDYEINCEWITDTWRLKNNAGGMIHIMISPNNSSSNRSCLAIVGDKVVEIFQKGVGEIINVAFDTNGGSELPKSGYVMGSEYGDLPTPIKAGCSFDGWKIDINDTTFINEDTEVTNVELLHAQWTTNSYTICYDSNGADVGSMDNQKLLFGEVASLYPNRFHRDGFVMSGWALTPAGDVVFENEECIVNLTSKDEDKIVLYACWKKPTYSLFLNANGGFVSPEMYSIACGEIFEALPIPIRPDYTFIGWYNIVNGGEKINEPIIVTSNVTYYARWVYDGPPTISTVVSEGCEAMGKVMGGKTAKAGTKLTLKATANKGYVFSHWDGPLGDAIDSRNPSISYVAGEDDAEFVARFIPVKDDVAAISFTMPKECQNGVAIANISVDVSGCSSLPTVKVTGLPAGLKFASKPICKKGSMTEVEVPANTIYGTPTKSGVYTIVATVTTAGKKTAAYSQTVIVRKSGEKVVVAQCDASGGNVKGAGVYPTGKKVAVKATANKGYVFAGWYDDASFTTPCDSTLVDYRTASYSYTMGTDDKTFYARFIPALEDSVINLKVNEKSVPTTFTVPKDAPLSIDVDSLSLPKISVKGLPAGMKFTPKPIYKKGSKTEVQVPANTIYGEPTKLGLYKISVSLSNASIKKAIIKEFTIEVPNLTGANAYFANDLGNGVGEKYVLSAGIANIDDFLPNLKLKTNTAKLAVKGLPSGLKYDAKTGKITGVATKPGSYVVYLTVTEGRNKYVSTITVEVQALLEWAVGTFSAGDGWYYADVKGPIPWYGEAGYDFVFNLSVDSKGRLSGSLTVDVTAGKQEKATFSALGAAGFIEFCHLEYWHDWQHGIGWRPECEYNGPAYYYDVDIKLHGVVQKRRLYICDASYGNRLEEGVPEPTVEGMGIAIFANAKLREGREDPEFLFEGTASMNLWKNKAYSGSLPKFASSTIKLQTISEGGSLCDLVIKQSGVVAITILKDNGVKDSASTDLEIYTINSDGSFHVIGNWIFQRGSASDIEMIFRPNKNGIITADDIEIIDLDVDDDPNWDED